MENKDDHLRFLQVLRALAAITKTELLPFMVDRYDAELQRFGYKNVAVALEGFFNDLGNNSRFPSINQIKSLLGESSFNEEEIARDTIAKLRDSVSRFGSWNHEDALRYVGPLGRHLISVNGGWNAFLDCCNTYENMNFFLAQLREQAKIAIKKDRGGILDQPLIPVSNSPKSKLKEEVVAKLLTKAPEPALESAKPKTTDVSLSRERKSLTDRFRDFKDG